LKVFNSSKGVSFKIYLKRILEKILTYVYKTCIVVTSPHFPPSLNQGNYWDVFSNTVL